LQYTLLFIHPLHQNPIPSATADPLHPKFPCTFPIFSAIFPSAAISSSSRHFVILTPHSPYIFAGGSFPLFRVFVVPTHNLHSPETKETTMDNGEGEKFVEEDISAGGIPPKSTEEDPTSAVSCSPRRKLNGEDWRTASAEEAFLQFSFCAKQNVFTPNFHTNYLKIIHYIF
jgi:hypothetical protein